MSEIADPLRILGVELDAAAQRSRSGFDIAPSRRARLEVLAGVALASGVDAQRLLSFCRRHLPVDAAVELSGESVRIDIWQRRAPVEPTSRS
jgi:hypothetical protein